MPIYEYKCDRCEDLHELEQRVTDDVVATLPCGLCDGTLKRVFSFGVKRSGQEMPPGSR